MYLLTASGGLAVGGAGFMLYKWLQWPPLNLAIKRTRRLGTTFSQLQCSYLGIDYKEAFNQICSIGFNTIRLCSYWNEIERRQNEFDFTVLDYLLDAAEKQSIDVVLTVGMKAPRWPEFHFPKWVKDQYNTSRTDKPLDANPALADLALMFNAKVIEHTKNFNCIRYWQVENEAFNRPEVAAGRFLSYNFVQREVELTRKLSLPHHRILL